MTITEILNAKQQGVSNFSEAFWCGYRAFVYGGRIVQLNNSTPKIEIGNLNPFDEFSEQEKLDWRDGIEYAKSERAECIALMQGHKKPYSISKEVKLKREKVLEILAEGERDLNVIANIVGFKLPTVKRLAIRNGYLNINGLLPKS